MSTHPIDGSSRPRLEQRGQGAELIAGDVHVGECDRGVLIGERGDADDHEVERPACQTWCAWRGVAEAGGVAQLVQEHDGRRDAGHRPAIEQHDGGRRPGTRARQPGSADERQQSADRAAGDDDDGRAGRRLSIDERPPTSGGPTGIAGLCRLDQDASQVRLDERDRTDRAVSDTSVGQRRERLVEDGPIRALDIRPHGRVGRL